MIGVPSRLSPALLAFAPASSRTGRTLRSAYLRQLSPHESHRSAVARPFGAFHHVSDSRVRHAPQLGCPRRPSSTTTEPSSSSGVASRAAAAAAAALALSPFFPAARSARMRTFSSPSLELRPGVVSGCGE